MLMYYDVFQIVIHSHAFCGQTHIFEAGTRRKRLDVASVGLKLAVAHLSSTRSLVTCRTLLSSIKFCLLITLDKIGDKIGQYECHFILQLLREFLVLSCTDL